MHITFVSPRYGASIHGGAEMAIRMLATKLADAGHVVDVHTTTALNMSTWADEQPTGTSTDALVTVHRHRTTKRRHRRFDAISTKVLTDPAAATPKSERHWIEAQGPHSPDLIAAIAEASSDVLVFSPYLYEPTLMGVPVARCPVVVHPALHNEPPMHLPAVRKAIGSADGLGFYTNAERLLTEKIIPPARSVPQMLVGLGVEQSSEHSAQSSGASDPRSALGLGDEPYFLVLGRVDRGKGTHALIEMFAALRASGRITARLVVAGPIADRPPDTPGVTITGPVNESVKRGLLEGATALINPSVMESFSLVLLESWMAGTPVLVNARCAATVEHAGRSGGGFAYADIDQLDLALRVLLSMPEVAAHMAKRGRSYVESWYTWPAILNRYVPFLQQVINHARPFRRVAPAV